MAKKIKRQKTVAKNVITEEKSTTTTVKFPKKIFPFVLGLLVVAGVIYFGGKVFFAASVNGQLINRFSIIKELEKQGGKKTLDTIILKALINQEAKKRKVIISEKELETELLKIENNVTSQGTTLEALLLQQGMTKNDLKNEIKLQLLVTKMVDNNISVTDKEVEDYMTSQKDLPALGGDQSATQITKDQAKAVVKQQKIQAKIQTFVADLKAKAKISYFVKY